MSDDGYRGTKGLIPFSYVITLIVPVTAPVFSFALHREGQDLHAATVLVLGVVWAVALAVLVL